MVSVCRMRTVFDQYLKNNRGYKKRCKRCFAFPQLDVPPSSSESAKMMWRLRAGGGGRLARSIISRSSIVAYWPGPSVNSIFTSLWRRSRTEEP